MTRDTWEQLGRPRLNESGIYLKLSEQGCIEPIRVWRNVDKAIKYITTKVEFEIIDPKEGSKSSPTLLVRRLDRKIKASFSSDKERINLKENGKKVTFPIRPSQGEP